MKRYTTIAVAVTIAVTAACRDNAVVNPIDAPTVDALNGPLTRVTLQELATGALAQDRGSVNAFAFAIEPGIWARDVYRIDASEPRFVQETLGGNPDPGSFSGNVVFSGGIGAELLYNQPLGGFFATLFNNASVTDLWGSVLKTTLFGAIIAIVCSYKGMTASGGAAGVGRAVNEAVVIAFMGVFAFNYVFTQTLRATHPELQTIR